MTTMVDFPVDPPTDTTVEVTSGPSRFDSILIAYGYAFEFSDLKRLSGCTCDEPQAVGDQWCPRIFNFVIATGMCLYMIPGMNDKYLVGLVHRELQVQWTKFVTELTPIPDTLIAKVTKWGHDRNLGTPRNLLVYDDGDRYDLPNNTVKPEHCTDDPDIPYDGVPDTLPTMPPCT
jgi:hypothetical protein